MINENNEGPICILDCNCAKLLLVDDNEFNLYALSKLLNKKNIIHDKAYNGEEALQKVEERL